MFKKFVIAYDHNVQKRFIDRICATLKEKNIAAIVVEDNEEANDYPCLAVRALDAFKSGGADGFILLCGTGIGMNMVANKFNGIRSVLANSEAEAYFARRHENANCLVFGAGYSDEKFEIKFCGRKMVRIINVFIETEFQGEERHLRRISEISDIEKDGGRK